MASSALVDLAWDRDQMLMCAAVVHEELGKHFCPRADAKELRMRAKFCPIVRCWGCRCAQSVWRAAECIKQRLQCLTAVVLDDAGFIQHHTHEPRCVEFVEPVIVGDVDAGANI